MKNYLIFHLTLWTVLFIALPVFGQFPRRCVDQKSLYSRTCCPLAADDSRCGETSGRGECTEFSLKIGIAPLNQTLKLLLDERAWWPRAFYDRACVCSGNFDGVDCSECKHGYEGDLCDKKSPIRIRKNLKFMSPEEIKLFVHYLDRSKKTISQEYVLLTTTFDRILKGETPQFTDTSIYNIFVWMHYYAARKNLVFPDNLTKKFQKDTTPSTPFKRRNLARMLLFSKPKFLIETAADYAHEGPAFPPWHRYFLLKWEKEVREKIAKDPNFALPYWNWIDKTNCSVCKDSIFGSEKAGKKHLISDRSPFSKWKTICNEYQKDLLQGKQCGGDAEGVIHRNLGKFNESQTDGLPTFSDVKNTFNKSDGYDIKPFNKFSNGSFRNLLEGYAKPETGKFDGRSYMHNAVHLWFNGTMSDVAFSPNDPIFISHHAFVDYLYEIWIRYFKNPNSKEEYFKNPNGSRVGHRPYDYMVPFFPLVRNENGFNKSVSYGYDYQPHYPGINEKEWWETDFMDKTMYRQKLDKIESKLTVFKT